MYWICIEYKKLGSYIPVYIRCQWMEKCSGCNDVRNLKSSGYLKRFTFCIFPNSHLNGGIIKWKFVMCIWMHCSVSSFLDGKLFWMIGFWDTVYHFYTYEGNATFDFVTEKDIEVIDCSPQTHECASNKVLNCFETMTIMLVLESTINRACAIAIHQKKCWFSVCVGPCSSVVHTYYVRAR